MVCDDSGYCLVCLYLEGEVSSVVGSSSMVCIHLLSMHLLCVLFPFGDPRPPCSAVVLYALRYGQLTFCVRGGGLSEN